MEQTARTILITGATSGIGLAAAEELADRGWQVLGVGRSPESCRKADAVIRSCCPQAKLAWFAADLATLAEVNRLAETVGIWLDARGSALDVLLNNAATVRSWYMATADGYEMQFAVNHLAGFLLTQRLLPRLSASPLARVLNISSGSHKGTRIRWNDIMNRRHYNCLRAYKQSKLCNVLFTREFNRRSAGTNVRAFAIDPGLVHTEIGSKWTGGIVAYFWQQRSRHGISAWQAASAIAYLCKMPPDWQTPSDYFHHCVPAEPSRAGQDAAAGSRLWELSARLCGLEAATQSPPARVDDHVQFCAANAEPQTGKASAVAGILNSSREGA